MKRILLSALTLVVFACATNITPADAKFGLGLFQRKQQSDDPMAQFTQDQGKSPVLLTASKRKIATHKNAFEKGSWNPFSARNRHLRRLQKSTTKGGYATSNTPFQGALWSPKLPPVRQAIAHKFFNSDGKTAHPKPARSKPARSKPAISGHRWLHIF